MTGDASCQVRDATGVLPLAAIRTQEYFLLDHNRALVQKGVPDQEVITDHHPATPHQARQSQPSGGWTEVCHGQGTEETEVSGMLQAPAMAGKGRSEIYTGAYEPSCPSYSTTVVPGRFRETLQHPSLPF